jgi:hypothetical protein
MRSIILGSLTALTVMAATAAEDRESANFMLPMCKRIVDGNHSTADAFDQGRCFGMAEAIAFMATNSDVGVTAFQSEGQLTAIQRRWRCTDIPKAVTKGQILRVVVRYIEARPNRMHENFGSLALEAMLDAWPCRN